MDHLKLTVDKLSVDEISDLVVDDSCGAVSLFVGTTRNYFEGKKVLCLEYEAYEPMALKAMKDICNEVRNKWPAVYSIAMYHRLGMVPAREASVVIAVSSPHRRDALDSVAHLIDQLKASVPIWKKEVYDGDAPVWKENAECPPETSRLPQCIPDDPVDKNLIQINVSNEELEQRIQNFIERKREQVNLNNIHDFIPSSGQSETEDTETCARIRTQFVRRKDAKGNLKTRKVNNEWGPQTAQRAPLPQEPVLPGGAGAGLPASIAERVVSLERYLGASVSPDVFRRLKALEDRVAELQAVSPEYAQFWKINSGADDVKEDLSTEYTFSADDISQKIEMFEKGES